MTQSSINGDGDRLLSRRRTEEGRCEGGTKTRWLPRFSKATLLERLEKVCTYECLTAGRELVGGATKDFLAVRPRAGGGCGENQWHD